MHKNTAFHPFILAVCLLLFTTAAQAQWKQKDLLGKWTLQQLAVDSVYYFDADLPQVMVMQQQFRLHRDVPQPGTPIDSAQLVKDCRKRQKALKKAFVQYNRDSSFNFIRVPAGNLQAPLREETGLYAVDEKKGQIIDLDKKTRQPRLYTDARIEGKKLTLVYTLGSSHVVMVYRRK